MDYEFFTGSFGNTNKIKSLQCALDLVLQSAPVLKLIYDKKTNAVSPQRACETKLNKNSDRKLENLDVNVPKQVFGNNTNIIDSNVFRSEGRFAAEKVSAVDDGMKVFADYHEDSGHEDKFDDSVEERRMLELLESRTQYILRVLTKRCTSLSSHPKYVTILVLDPFLMQLEFLSFLKNVV